MSVFSAVASVVQAVTPKKARRARREALVARLAEVEAKIARHRQLCEQIAKLEGHDRPHMVESLWVLNAGFRGSDGLKALYLELRDCESAIHERQQIKDELIETAQQGDEKEVILRKSRKCMTWERDIRDRIERCEREIEGAKFRRQQAEKSHPNFPPARTDLVPQLERKLASLHDELNQCRRETMSAMRELDLLGARALEV